MCVDPCDNLHCTDPLLLMGAEFILPSSARPARVHNNPTLKRLNFRPTAELEQMCPLNHDQSTCWSKSSAELVHIGCSFSMHNLLHLAECSLQRTVSSASGDHAVSRVARKQTKRPSSSFSPFDLLKQLKRAMLLESSYEPCSQHLLQLQIS